mmetsp:Transcript_77414/g.134085  ORF Transcript_77414/g.134085 Transcript_77414/m.134085 type:complete len:253 (-) Transcript_77414:950-1708(-)
MPCLCICLFQLFTQSSDLCILVFHVLVPALQLHLVELTRLLQLVLQELFLLKQLCLLSFQNLNAFGLADDSLAITPRRYLHAFPLLVVYFHERVRSSLREVKPHARAFIVIVPWLSFGVMRVSVSFSASAIDQLEGRIHRPAKRHLPTCTWRIGFVRSVDKCQTIRSSPNAITHVPPGLMLPISLVPEIEEEIRHRGCGLRVLEHGLAVVLPMCCIGATNVGKRRVLGLNSQLGDTCIFRIPDLFRPASTPA